MSPSIEVALAIYDPAACVPERASGSPRLVGSDPGTPGTDRTEDAAEDRGSDRAAP